MVFDEKLRKRTLDALSMYFGSTFTILFPLVSGFHSICILCAVSTMEVLSMYFGSTLNPLYLFPHFHPICTFCAIRKNLGCTLDVLRMHFECTLDVMLFFSFVSALYAPSAINVLCMSLDALWMYFVSNHFEPSLLFVSTL